ncbi:hypothetical protein Pint_17530 [Pistacia integerrima]|uniref:Uncharacterized protein n=1 Tax=Pistacia integerrima TaxID=434235 RepID=A0ACC0YVU4_9ROSI|nr:hypothetical protein Pint_17530 [Pistacia integerrima]
MPAISVSSSLHFPANLLEKLETRFFRKRCLQFKSNQNLQSVLLFKEKRSFISVLAKGTFKKNQECIVDLKNRKGWIHFVGVGGCGLSALAVLALKQGFEVSGSDMMWSSYMDGLQAAGACLHIGHSISNIQRNNESRFPDALVISSAIPQDNVEILHAKSVGVPVYKRDYWLAKLTENFNLVAVSGSHGNTIKVIIIIYCTFDTLPQNYVVQ